MESEKAIARILAKRKAALNNDKGTFKLEEYLFPEQLAFVIDPSPNKVAVCSRRSGKTVACAADLIHTALSNDDVKCWYITLKRNNAKKIIWKELLKINREYKLGGEANLTELSLTFPNDSVIFLSGAKDESEIENFRGMAIKLCYIDEAQSFREYIRDLLNDVLAPALMDHAGTLCLIGTPGAVPVGYFAEVSGQVPDKIHESENWSYHAWTFWDNPHITVKSKLTHQQMLDRELKRRGVPANDPSIQREWYGKWVKDEDSLLIHYNKDLNHFESLPKMPMWHYIMGVDLGYNDADAIAILAWSDFTPETYLIDEVVTNKQGISELVNQIEGLLKRYPVDKIVMDEGGLGKKIAEEIRRQKGIPIHGADKKLKMQNIAFLNDALRTNRFKAKRNSRFANDSYLVEIDVDRSTPEKIAVSDAYHSDIIDAVLYAFKESPAFAYEVPKKKLVPGTKEWAEAQEDHMFEAEVEGLKKAAEFERWQNGQYD